MPRTVKEYRRRAADAERQAKVARSPEERAAFNEIAALWRRMADERSQRLASPDSCQSK